ncbi:MAG TPA: DinB family protein [Actinospica sp.]|nr:DinB family protein [Actinospica sp.]
MSDSEVAAKSTLQRYLVSIREALLWKLDGLSPYDARRPLTPTGTNLLGLVKHVAYVSAGYLGDCFDRPFGEPYPWDEGDEEDNLDLWVPAEESTEQILALYARVWKHADATIEALDLDSPGLVPWWSEERRHVTLQQILIHLIAEINRHAGQADILREQLDDSVGLKEGVSNIPEHDADWWRAYVARIEEAAKAVRAQP